MTSYQRKDLSRFYETLRGLPALYSKHAVWRNMPLVEIVEKAMRGNTMRLAKERVAAASTKTEEAFIATVLPCAASRTARTRHKQYFGIGSKKPRLMRKAVIQVVTFLGRTAPNAG